MVVTLYCPNCRAVTTRYEGEDFGECTNLVISRTNAPGVPNEIKECGFSELTVLIQ